MIILNEKKYAEECLEKGIVDKKPYKTLMLLAKYYYHHLGYRKKLIIKCLTDFMVNNYPEYRVAEQNWNDTIEKIANRAKKYTLHENSGVWICESELNDIASLKNEKLERLAFTLLSIAKLNYIRNEKSNGWVNSEENDIFESAGIKCTNNEKSDCIGDLYISGMIALAKKNTNLNVRVTFMNTEDRGTLFISDFRALGNEYAKYRGSNYIRCESCGLLVRGNKNGTKRFCNACAKHNRYVPIVSKTLICVDCGKEFVVDARLSNKLRCDECQKIHRRDYQKKLMRDRKTKII